MCLQTNWFWRTMLPPIMCMCAYVQILCQPRGVFFCKFGTDLTLNSILLFQAILIALVQTMRIFFVSWCVLYFFNFQIDQWINYILCVKTIETANLDQFLFSFNWYCSLNKRPKLQLTQQVPSPLLRTPLYLFVALWSKHISSFGHFRDILLFLWSFLFGFFCNFAVWNVYSFFFLNFAYSSAVRIKCITR